PATPAPRPIPPSMAALDVDGFYERLATHGLGYSGPFRAVQGLGREPAHPQRLSAEGELPAGTEGSGYGIHPPLLDARLHPPAALIDPDGTDSVPLRLPFAFTGIHLWATGATRLQVQLSATGTDTFRLDATDPTGAAVISIRSVTLRELP